MNITEALKILGISEYKQRIINSNSHGELFHLYDYIRIAGTLKEQPKDLLEFKKSFEINVKHAEDTWSRPESVFQHVLKMFN